jgi:hypothetical protein
MSNTSSPVTRLQLPNALRYQPAYEKTEEDEAETTAGLVATIEKIQTRVHADSGVAARGAHAKSHGLLRGELRVLDGLPPVLAQGLFAAAGAYPVVLRYSSTPGDMLDDAVSTPRGLAIPGIAAVGQLAARLPG